MSGDRPPKQSTLMALATHYEAVIVKQRAEIKRLRSDRLRALWIGALIGLAVTTLWLLQRWCM